MNALVVYESMFGNTRQLAEAAADALRSSGAATTLAPAAAAPADLTGFDLIVVGAPTHAHSLPRASTRIEATKWASDPAKALHLEPGAAGPGIREWLDRLIALPLPHPAVALFSTRADIPRIFSGDAASAMKKRLRVLGSETDAHAEFLVDLHNRLTHGEEQRIRDWVTHLIPVGGR